MWWRWGVLYPLYFLAESAIVFTDLAELIGSAIAITLVSERYKGCSKLTLTIPSSS
jgi:Mn2+/Fe2+ NRAMP family transporter